MNDFHFARLTQTFNLNISDFNCIPQQTSNGSHNVFEYEMVNNFLIDPKKARRLSSENIIQTFLLIDSRQNKIAGYYSICVGSKVTYKQFKKSKNVPTIGRNKELPTIDIIWFGVDQEYQKRKLGTGMLNMVLKRACFLAERVGICLITVDSLPSSKPFYERLGFLELGIPHKESQDSWLGLTIVEAKQTLYD
jgi:GNAT superfamily N-acetyltransferase